MKKKVLLAMAGFWILTIIFLVIGLGCLGVKIDDGMGGSVNGYKYLAPVTKNISIGNEAKEIESGVDNVLSKDYQDLIDSLKDQKTAAETSGAPQDMIDAMGKQITFYQTVKVGVIFSVILVPIAAGLAIITGVACIFIKN
ncbi:hypothetical protein [Spiroplasma eriocheiris]|uniref:Transmembrane protein n=1 Tax=Spiroplasma eriocheiris TaxID=315358 RepID=A0A0H3XIU5_9MOLU|nr:hypothetical protein [Spiroplasma eriocheiris]AHF57209.1 hypothetical protein SPE_0073 [Spiroplasma eriocheiris CCTCC M 207170]AKM53676.1 hypothetical protein SERIO_v1c00740 [Spiroplasma eriocheiris]